MSKVVGKPVNCDAKPHPRMACRWDAVSGGAPDPESGNLLLLTLGTSPLLAGLRFFIGAMKATLRCESRNQIRELERITYFTDLLNRIWTLLIGLLKNKKPHLPHPPVSHSNSSYSLKMMANCI